MITRACRAVALLPSLFLLSCSDNGSVGSGPGPDDLSGIDFRSEMRAFVEELTAYAEAGDGLFLIVTQNGQELISRNGEPDGSLATEYLAALDGVGQEDLFYGYEADDLPTPPAESDWIVGFLDRVRSSGKEVLVTDYCFSHEKMADSYLQNEEHGYHSFAADHRELDNIPSFPEDPHSVHSDSVGSLADVRNFLYLINPESFQNRAAYMDTLRATRFDLLLLDAFYHGTILTQGEVAQLRVKPNGSTRLVLAYLSIGEAEDYRYYWEADWENNRPIWLESENPDWPGNFHVRYWDPAWQAIIYGSEDSYLDRVIKAGFDGVYLDIIEGYEYFEELTGMRLNAPE